MFVRDCVFAYCASVTQYVYSLSAEQCFRLRNNAISDKRVQDCALNTHSMFRPLRRRNASEKYHVYSNGKAIRGLNTSDAVFLPLPYIVMTLFVEYARSKYPHC